MINNTTLASVKRWLLGVFVRPAEERRPLLRALVPAILLGWVTMFAGLSHILQRVMSFRGSKVGSAVLQEALELGVLKQQFAAFLASHVLIHTLFGVFLWVLAVATLRAFPALRLRTTWVVVAWWVLVGSWIYVANAMLFTESRSGPALEFVRTEIIAHMTFYHIYTAIAATAIVIVLGRAIALSPARRLIARVAVYGIVILSVVGVLAGLRELHAGSEERPMPAKPHVILIGLDSLRPDMVGLDEDAWYTPNLKAFLKESQVFPDAMTPLARTFASWMSILTGRHPVSTGARDNLVPLERVNYSGSLPERMKRAGYRTIYATDDVRFSNIDQRYSFDKIIGPRMGASDFVLGNYNDMPLSNLIANTRLAKWLFPNTYGNRAAEITYRPDTFTDWVARELEFDSPTFLAIHLTLPHFPFTWAHEADDAFSGSHDTPFPYLAAVVAADEQFKELMALLERRGALDNAIVVVLSDHGEGLGLPADNLIRTQEGKDEARVLVWIWGHGTSVLSPQQYSVVLAFRRFMADRYAQPGAIHEDVPATLEDVTPTVLELAGIKASASDFEGISLAPYMDPDREGPKADISQRTRFTETGISVPLLKKGNPDKEGLFEQGAFYFGVDARTGLVELRDEQWDLMIAAKERAVVQGDWLLAAFPVDDGSRAHKYLLVNRKTGMPRRLEAVPDPASEPIAASLYDALHRRFPGELRPPADPSLLDEGGNHFASRDTTPATAHTSAAAAATAN